MKFWPLIKILPVKTNLHFVRYGKIFAVLSAVLIAGSLFLTLWPPKPPCFGLACGIDFKGGTVLEISTAPKAVPLHVARETLESMQLGEVQVQEFGSTSSAILRFQTPEGANAADTTKAVQERLKQNIPEV